MSTLTFYIGGHKTASSLVRKFLRTRKLDIEKTARVSCVDRSSIMQTRFFENIKKLSQGEGLTELELDQGKESLRQLVDGQACDNVLLHNEDFFTAIFFDNHPAIINYIKSCSSGFDVNFVLYIREQASYIESWYLQQIHVGNVVDFTRFSEKALRKRISWAQVCGNIEQMFGYSSLNCVPYETIRRGSHAFLQSFLERFVGPNIEIGDYNLESQNRSFSDIALKMALDYFPQLSDDDVRVYRRFLQNNFSTRTHMKPVLFSDEERERIKLEYESENRWMFERYTTESFDELWFR